MADAALLVKSRLIADSALTGVLGPVKVKSGDLPAKFDPAGGPAVTVMLHTGQVHEENPGALAMEILRVQVWAGDYLEAWSVYARIQELLVVNMVEVSPYGFIIKSTEMSHTPVTEEGTGWKTITGIFAMTIRNIV